MTEAPGIPALVSALAVERSAARAGKDFARSDLLRDEIASLGWIVKDTADGFALTERPPFAVLANLAALPAAAPTPPEARCTVAVLVDGWPDDLESCLRALLANIGDQIAVIGLDFGDVDGAGAKLHEISTEFSGRILEIHIDQPLARAGWAAAVSALAGTATTEFFAVMDVSTILTGDALTPILATFEDPAVVASGWRGVNVNTGDDWRTFNDAGPGEVDAVLGYLMVVRTDAARECPPNPKASFYRNADMEWSLCLREYGSTRGSGRIVVPAGDLPLRQDRHHAYHDTDPAYRDKESKKTYDRILQRFRGRAELLSPRE
jgi:Glycosyl transferase family 2